MDQSLTAHPPFPLASAHQLLTLLATDDAFRASFVATPKEALLRVGLLEWQADAALAGYSCLAVHTLASKQAIATGKDKLLEKLTSRAAHTVEFTFAEGGSQTATVAAA